VPSPWIKVHGITNVADARLAQAAGADAIGVVLISGDPVEVRLDEAAEIAANVTVETVVSVHETSEDFLREVLLTIEPTRLEVWQAPPPVDAPTPWYRAFPLRGRENLADLREYAQDRVLVQVSRDLLPPDGRRFLKDRSLLQEMGRLGRIVVGGDIDEKNVAAVVKHVRPWGLELSVSAEGDPRLKEWDALHTLIRRAREA